MIKEEEFDDDWYIRTHDSLIVKCISKQGLKKMTKGSCANANYELEVPMTLPSGKMALADIVIENQGQTFLVEVKPTVAIVGSVIRQIKLYKLYLGRKIDTLVLATYSYLSDDAKKMLEHEGIATVIFKPDEQPGMHGHEGNIFSREL